MNAYILIDTDGLTINHRFTLNYFAAKETMDKEFTEMAPAELKGVDDDMSYIDDWDAVLHVNGRIHLWKIVEVLGENAANYQRPLSEK